MSLVQARWAERISEEKRVKSKAKKARLMMASLVLTSSVVIGILTGIANHQRTETTNLKNLIQALQFQNEQLERQIEQAKVRQSMEQIQNTKNIEQAAKLDPQLFVEQEYSYVELPEKHKQWVLEECSKYDNVDPHLVFALIKQESSNDPKAVSPTGARGYGQFTYKTAKWVYQDMLKAGRYSREMAFDPHINIRMTVRYISYLISLKKDVGTALAFYNGFSDDEYVPHVVRWMPKEEKQNIMQLKLGDWEKMKDAISFS